MNEVKTNVKQILRAVDKAYKDQLPFACALALTRTAQDAQRAMVVQASRKLDRPTPFTLKGFGWKKATKQNLESVVYIKPIQSRYLRWAIQGGTRLPTGRAIPVPFGLNTNKYGNMPRGKIKQLLARPDTFSGVVKGVAGVWQRGHISKRGNFTTAGNSKATTIRLLVAYEPRATYRKRFPFYEIGQGVWRNRLPRNLRLAIQQAIDTAR